MQTQHNQEILKLKEDLQTARKLAQESLNEKEQDLQDQLSDKCNENEALRASVNDLDSKLQKITTEKNRLEKQIEELTNQNQVLED